MRWLVSLFVALALIALGLWLFQSSQELAPVVAEPTNEPRPADARAAEQVEAAPDAPAERAPATAAEAAKPASVTNFELRIRGACVDTQERPIAGVEVDCWIYYTAADVASLAGSREYTTFDKDAHPRAQSDAQGRFEFAFAPPQRAESAAFRVRMWLKAEGRARADASVDVARTETGDLGVITLPLASSLRGVVVDAKDAPIAGARVRVWPKDSSQEGREISYACDPVQSAADGRFTLLAVPPGKLDLGARTEDMRESKRLTLDLGESESKDDLRLVVPVFDDANSISGIVLSPKGEPVARARMRLVLRPTPGGGSASYGFSCDAQGRFRHDLAGAGARLSAEDGAGLYGGAVLEEVQPGMHGLRIQLPAAVMLALHAVDEHGPVESFGWSIKKEMSKNSFEGEVPVAQGPRPGGLAQVRAPIEPFYVGLQALGYRSLELGPFRADALPAEALFRLEPALGIRGSVSTGGKPLAGARVELYEALEEGRGGNVDNLPARMLPIDQAPHAESAQDGSFLLAVDRPGVYHVRASAPGFAPTVSGRLEYEPGAGLNGVALGLTRGGGIEGRNYGADGAPRAAQWIAASDGWPPASGAKTDGEGGFRFEHLAPGKYRLFEVDRPVSAQPNGWGTGMQQADFDARFDCEVREGEVTHFDLRAAQPAELILALPAELGALGEWNVSAFVDVDGRSRQGSSNWSEKRDELRLQFPASGKCTLYLRLPSESHGSERFSLAGKFDLPPGRSTQSLGFGLGGVRLTIGPGKEPGAIIRIGAQIGTEWNFGASGTADSSGVLVFPCVPAAKCRVMRGGESAWRDVEVKAGETSLVENL